MLTPGVASLAPAPYRALGQADAAARNLGEGDQVEVTVSGRALKLPVRVLPGLPPGVAGLPASLPGLEGLALPAWSEPAAGSRKGTAAP